jgi:hypothetical protein
MNPVTLLILGSFLVIAVAFPVLMVWAGLGTGGILLVMAFIVVTEAAIFAWIVWMARRFARDYQRLLAGEHWVRWQTTPQERAGFVASERTRARGDARRYILYALILAAVGAVVMWFLTDSATGAAVGFGVLGLIGAIVVVTTWLWGGARQREEASDIDDIILGELGIYHLGTYTPVKGFNLFLTRVDYVDEIPPALSFWIGSRTQHGIVRQNEVRVLVPAGREEEGRDIAARFRRHFDLKSP